MSGLGHGRPAGTAAGRRRPRTPRPPRTVPGRGPSSGEIDVRRGHLGAAAAEHPGVRGQRADHRDPGQRRRPPAAACSRSLRASTNERAATSCATRVAVHFGRCGVTAGGHAVQRADPGGEAQHPAYLVVDRPPPAPAPDADRLRPAWRPTGSPAPAWRCPGRRGPRRPSSRAARQSETTTPSKPHSSLSTPVCSGPFEAIGRPFTPLYARHHAPAAGPDDPLERRQVDLPQRPLADPDVDGHPVGLEVVAHQMLDRGADAVRLHTRHEPGADLAAEQRILRVALEVPAAERGALQVHRRAEQHVHALAPGLLAEQQPGRARQRRIPGGGQRGRAGQRDRRVLRRPAGAADADRAVRHDQRRSPIRGIAGNDQKSCPASSDTFSSRSSLSQQRFDRARPCEALPCRSTAGDPTCAGRRRRSGRGSCRTPTPPPATPASAPRRRSPPAGPPGGTGSARGSRRRARP